MDSETRVGEKGKRQEKLREEQRTREDGAWVGATWRV
jgi:hypothetical protein